MFKDIGYDNIPNLNHFAASLCKDRYGNKIERVVCSNSFSLDIFSHPEFCCVIVAYNESPLAVEKLLKQFSTQIATVLVDNSGSQLYKPLADSYCYKYVETSENVGCSSGRNIGSLFIPDECKHIVFVDSDGEVLDDFLKSLVSAVSDFPDYTAMRGRVVDPFANPSRSTNFPTHYDIGKTTCFTYIDCEGISIWKRSVFVSAGGFEDDLAGGEGPVLSYRLFKYHSRRFDSFLYVPDLVLLHQWHVTTEKLIEKKYRSLFLWDILPLAYEGYEKAIGFWNDSRKENSQEYSIAIPSSDSEEILRRGELKFRLSQENFLSRVKRRKYSKPLTPAVTVIITCYNLGDYLGEAVDSCLAQCLEDVEIIIIDDKSDDTKTIEVLNDLSANGLDVLVLPENGGVAAARNYGIARSRGEFVICLDADDKIDFRYAFSVFHRLSADASVGIVAPFAQFFGNSRYLWRVSEDAKDSSSYFVMNQVPTVSGFRKSAHTSVGGYDVSMRGYEDWSHWVAIVCRDWTVSIVERPLFFYRVRKNSKVITSNKLHEEYFSKIVATNILGVRKCPEKILLKMHNRIWDLQASRSRVSASTHNERSTDLALVKELLRGKVGKRDKYFALFINIGRVFFLGFRGRENYLFTSLLLIPLCTIVLGEQGAVLSIFFVLFVMLWLLRKWYRYYRVLV
ncbi:glycosyltransferase [Gammaproteobacteria bacterium]|nr:glycosyltransferase [Gammaproteobacteria bacterium]